MGLREQITEDMKAAMRAKEAGKLNTIRLIIADIKRKEVDERTEVNDEQTLAIVEKMIKQRKDSITQFEAGNRQDLADTARQLRNAADAMRIHEHGAKHLSARRTSRANLPQ